MKPFKFDLKSNGDTVIRMPLKNRFMSIQAQHNKPVIWLACDPVDGYHERTIYSVPTGGEVGNDFSKYIGTVTIDGGSFTLHYFYR